MLRRLWTHRALLTSLVRRQYQLRYRQSAVGLAWAVLPPIATVVIGAVVFEKVADLPTPGPYVLFAAAGMVPWTFFASSVSQGVPSIVGALMMVTRLPFPRAVIPLSVVGLSLLDLLIAGMGFVGVAIFYGATGRFDLPATALFFPVLLLIEVPLIMGVVLLGSAINVFARDIRLAVPFLVQFWLLVTPVLYPLDEAIRRAPELRPLFLANPMTGVVESFHDILILGRLPSFEVLLPAIIGAVGFLVIGVWYFAQTEPRMADVV
jgi:lipopolysaccharide transport system permease protein